tara:strand:- start:90 stop:503 length:414 start_codon:yes stop_codon:yes gene_type:complete
MPDFSLGFGNLYGRFVKDEKQPERRSTGGGQSGSEAFSQRFPAPKPIGGPLAGLGEAATSTAMGLGNVFGRFIEGGRQVSGDVQDVTGKTYATAKDAFQTVVGVPGTIVEGVTDPVGQLSKDILPLAAIAAALVLLK